MKCKKTLIILIFLILCTFAFVRECRKYFEEMDNFMMNKEYSFNIEKIEDMEECVLHFDYDNPHKIIGQVIFQNGKNKIVVSDATNESEKYVRLYFESTGTYDILRDKGIFISPVVAYIDEEKIWRIEGSLINVSPVEDYKCQFTSKTCEYEGFTNRFSIDITARNYEHLQVSKKENRMVTLTFCELWKMEWEKQKS